MKQTTFLLTLTLAAALPSTTLAAPCVRKLPSGRLSEPRNYAALRACQQRQLDAFVELTFSTKADRSSIAVFKKLQARQHEEQSDYLSRHPRSVHASAIADSSDPLPGVEAPSSSSRRGQPLKNLKWQLKQLSRGGTEGLSPEMTQAVNEFVLND